MSTINEFKQIKTKFFGLEARKNLLIEQLEELQNQMQVLELDHSAAIKARSIFQDEAKKIQSTLEYHLSALVTTALSAVFPNSPKFITEIVTKRNQTELNFYLEENGVRSEPFFSSGGGVVDITALALRLSFWSLKKTRPTFILDEPTRNLSVNYHEKVSEMLKMLSKKMGIQFIIVSHQEGINKNADKIFKVSKQDSISVVQ